MSLAIDTATKVHEKQIHVVTRSQEVAVSAVEKVASAVQSLRTKSPKVPTIAAGPLETLTAPVTKVVGDTSDVTSYVARTVRDWADVQQTFQAAILRAIVPGQPAVPAPKKKAKA